MLLFFLVHLFGLFYTVMKRNVARLGFLFCVIFVMTIHVNTYLDPKTIKSTDSSEIYSDLNAKLRLFNFSILSEPYCGKRFTSGDEFKNCPLISRNHRDSNISVCNHLNQSKN